MIVEDYHKLIDEIVDIDTEVSSIADSRRLLVELSEREAILLKLKESIVKDIRSAESNFLRDKSSLRNKYSMNQKTGITGMTKRITKK